MKKWTETEIVEAFNPFITANDPNEIEKIIDDLRIKIKAQGEGPYDNGDVLSITTKIVPGHCCMKMADAVIQKLEENENSDKVH